MESYFPYEINTEHLYQINDAQLINNEIQYNNESRNKAETLGIKCKMLVKFCLYNLDDIELQPPKIADALGTSRRRIYDILQVCEVIGLVERKTHRLYNWLGVNHLNEFINKIRINRDNNNAYPIDYSVYFYGLHLGLELSNSLDQYSMYTTIVKGININLPSECLGENYSEIAAGDYLVEIGNTSLIGKSYDEIVEITKKVTFPITIRFQHPRHTCEIWPDQPGVKIPLLTNLTRRLLYLYVSQHEDVFYLKDISKIFLHTIDECKTMKSKYIETRLYDVVNVLSSLGIVEKCSAKKQKGQSLGIRFTGIHNIQPPVIEAPIEHKKNNLSPSRKRRKIDPWKCQLCSYINKYTFPKCAKCEAECINYNDSRVMSDEE